MNVDDDLTEFIATQLAPLMARLAALPAAQRDRYWFGICGAVVETALEEAHDRAVMVAMMKGLLIPFIERADKH